MNRTRTKIVIVATLLVIAFAWWIHHLQGSIVARSTSPDGRWRILVYEHRPNMLLLEQSPYTYIYSLSATQPDSQSSEDFTHDNDSSMIDDFEFDWSPESATVFWGRRQWSVRADISKQPIHWIENSEHP